MKYYCRQKTFQKFPLGNIIGYHCFNGTIIFQLHSPKGNNILLHTPMGKNIPFLIKQVAHNLSES